MPDDAARHDEAELVDRIGRVRHQDDVAGRGDGLRHVGEAFLGAERGDDLRVGIELHAEAALVIGALRPAQALDAARGGIAVGARVAHRLDQLLHDMLGRRHVGIAHAEIDDVVAARARLRLELVDLLEDVRRKPLDSVEIAVHALMSRCPPTSNPLPNGWAFEPQKRAPGQEAPAKAFGPSFAPGPAWSRPWFRPTPPWRFACSLCRSAIAAFC